MGEKYPPILEYRTPAPPERRVGNYAGCLVPISISIFALGALVIYSATEQLGKDRGDYYVRGIGIVLVAIVTLVIHLVVRKRDP